MSIGKYLSGMMVIMAGLGGRAADLSPVSPEKLPEGAKVVRLVAFPEKVELDGRFAYRQMVLTAELENGDKVDATRMAKWDAPSFTQFSPAGQVRAKADGAGTLKAELQGKAVSVPVSARALAVKQQTRFIQEVGPVMSRLGCNAGTCHGAADGKNGFKLSLRGYDPLFDHRSLTDDLEGRRFNRSAPDSSLMLLKISGGVAHVGGVLGQPGDPYYDILKTWIGDGVKLDQTGPRVTKVEVYPAKAVAPMPGMRQQLAILATFSDGVVRDVTSEAFLESSDTEVATVERGAVMTALRRGEATVLVRYEGNYAAAGLICMGDRKGFAWQNTPEFNTVDTLVYRKLKDLRILPSEVCADAEFIRRVTLDLTGLLPTPEEARRFLADARPQKVKRDDLVDRLVGSQAYIEMNTNKWADLLQVNRKFLGEQGAQAFRAYIRQSVADNQPYDQFARVILTGKGSNVEKPEASYYKI